MHNAGPVLSPNGLRWAACSGCLGFPADANFSGRKPLWTAKGQADVSPRAERLRYALRRAVRLRLRAFLSLRLFSPSIGTSCLGPVHDQVLAKCICIRGFFFRR